MAADRAQCFRVHSPSDATAWGFMSARGCSESLGLGALDLT